MVSLLDIKLFVFPKKINKQEWPFQMQFFEFIFGEKK